MNIMFYIPIAETKNIFNSNFFNIKSGRKQVHGHQGGWTSIDIDEQALMSMTD
jgi:hypothetical protein